MRFLSILVMFIVVGCATIDRTDSAHHKMIVGSWMLMDHGYEGEYTLSLVAFTKDGRKCVVATDYNLKGRGTRTDYWDNRWEIKDGYLVSTIVKSSSIFTEPGSKIRDKIVIFEKNIFHVLMESNSDYVPSLEKHIRLIDEDPSRICKIVDSEFGA